MTLIIFGNLSTPSLFVNYIPSARVIRSIARTKFLKLLKGFNDIKKRTWFDFVFYIRLHHSTGHFLCSQLKTNECEVNTFSLNRVNRLRAYVEHERGRFHHLQFKFGKAPSLFRKEFEMIHQLFSNYFAVEQRLMALQNCFWLQRPPNLCKLSFVNHPLRMQKVHRETCNFAISGCNSSPFCSLPKKPMPVKKRRKNSCPKRWPSWPTLTRGCQKSQETTSWKQRSATDKKKN